MPHRTVHNQKDGLANRDGALYADWMQGKTPHHRLATDGIARDILWITGRMPLPLETTAIMTAMSQQESALTLTMKLFLFGYMYGVHKQRRRDRLRRQNRLRQGAKGNSQGRRKAAATHPLKACVDDLQALADRLDSEYHVVEALERKVHREGHTGTDGSWHGDETALAVARERMTLLRSVLGDLEPILYRMEDEGSGQDANLKERGTDGQPSA